MYTCVCVYMVHNITWKHCTSCYFLTYKQRKRARLQSPNRQETDTLLGTTFTTFNSLYIVTTLTAIVMPEKESDTMEKLTCTYL